MNKSTVQITALDKIIEVTKAYLAANEQWLCYCDYIRYEFEYGGEAMNLWNKLHIEAFNTSPDYTGDDFYAISLEKYGLTFFPSDKFEGEYGQARRRLVLCVLEYFIILRHTI